MTPAEALLWTHSVGIIRETRASGRRAAAVLKATAPSAEVASTAATAVFTDAETGSTAVVHLGRLAERVAADVSRRAATGDGDGASQTAAAAAAYAHLLALAADLLRAGLNTAAAADKLVMAHKRAVMAALAAGSPRGEAPVLASVEPEAGTAAVTRADALFSRARLPPSLRPAAAGGAPSPGEPPRTPGAEAWEALATLQHSGPARCRAVLAAITPALAAGVLPPPPPAYGGGLESGDDEAVGAAVATVLAATAQLNDLVTKAVTVDVDATAALLADGVARSHWLWGHASEPGTAAAAFGSRPAAAQVLAHLTDRLTFAWNGVIVRYRQFGELAAATTAHSASQAAATHLLASLHGVLASLSAPPAGATGAVEPVPAAAVAAPGGNESGGGGGGGDALLEWVDVEGGGAGTGFSAYAPATLRTSAAGASSGSVADHANDAAVAALRGLAPPDAVVLTRLHKRATCLLSLLLPLSTIERLAGGSGSSDAAAPPRAHPLQPSLSPQPLQRLPPPSAGVFDLPALGGGGGGGWAAWESDEGGGGGSGVVGGSGGGGGGAGGLGTSDAEGEVEGEDDDGGAGRGSVTTGSSTASPLLSIMPGFHLAAAPVDAHLLHLRRRSAGRAAGRGGSDVPLEDRRAAWNAYVRYTEGVISDAVRRGARLPPSFGRMMAALYDAADRATGLSSRWQASEAGGSSGSISGGNNSERGRSVAASRPHPAVRRFYAPEAPGERPFVRGAAMWLLRMRQLIGPAAAADGRMVHHLLVVLSARATSKLLPSDSAAWWDARAPPPTYILLDTAPASKVLAHAATLTPHRFAAVVACLAAPEPADALAVRLLTALRAQPAGSGGSTSGSALAPGGAAGWLGDADTLALAESLARDGAAVSRAGLLPLAYANMRADDALRAIRVLSQATAWVAGWSASPAAATADDASASAVSTALRRARGLLDRHAEAPQALLRSLRAADLLPPPAAAALAARYATAVAASLQASDGAPDSDA